MLLAESINILSLQAIKHLLDHSLYVWDYALWGELHLLLQSYMLRDIITLQIDFKACICVSFSSAWQTTLYVTNRH